MTPDNCEREPIHIPGAIQPHGGLVAFEPATGTVSHASDNLDQWLSVGALPAFGRLLPDLLGEADFATLTQALERTTVGLVRHQIVALPARPELGRNQPLAVALHQHKGMCIAEFERGDIDPDTGLQALGDTIEGMRQAQDLDELVKLIALRVRQMIGFDRVMVYRFDAAWNGRVVADAHEPGMEDFLDLHYPASDIPPQARELYRSNLVRYIADVGYAPVPVRPWLDPLTKEPLDMSHAMLRSVSPMHIEYLRNMGVGSTLTLSLLVDGQLWGMVAAHHRTSTQLSPRLRQACYALAISAGYMVGWATHRQMAQVRARHQTLQSQVFDAFNQVQVPLASVVSHCALPLQHLVQATGGAMWRGTECIPFGHWLGGPRAAALLQQVREHFERSHDTLLALDQVELEPPLTDAERRSACGLLAIALEAQGRSGLLWLRPEWRRQVDWGGDPDKPAQLQHDARGQPMLTPRTSFARWSTMVSGRSRPWTELDREAAQSLMPLRAVLTVRESLNLVSMGERRFRSLVALQSDAYWRTDLLGNVLSMSKRLALMPDDVNPPNLFDLLRPLTVTADVDALSRALAEGTPFRGIRVRGVSTTGQPVDLQVNGEPLLDRGAQFAGWHGTIVDRSHEVMVQDAMRRSTAAELANREKSRFLSQISHELRTPLNAVLGFSQLLLDDASLQPPQRQKLQHIRKAGHWLLAMVSDLLDLSRIETGDLPVVMGSVDPVAVAQEAIDLVRPQADSDDIELALQPGPGVGRVAADPVRLKQIVVNLVTNAVKYNRPRGLVRVVIRGDVDETRLRIEVHDTGSGMSPEQMQHLFEAFNRLGREKQNVQGTGIGLVIAKRLTEAMGGRLHAESVLGQGSCFTAVLDYADSPEPQAADTSAGALGAPGGDLRDDRVAARVLYVEDDPVNVELMQAVVGTLPGMQMRHVSTAEEGWELVHQFRPDVVLIDLNLPGQPGTWLAERVRQDPALDHIHVVATTADAFAGTSTRLQQAGFDACWHKPLDLHELAQRLPALLRQRRSTREQVAIGFDDADAHARLDRLTAQGLDRLDFGVVRLNAAGLAVAYNACEARQAGLSPERVIGRRFFAEVAPCADNELVAGRLRDEPDLDVVLDYVFAFRLRHTPVRLRLLRSQASPHRYMLVLRSSA